MPCVLIWSVFHNPVTDIETYNKGFMQLVDQLINKQPQTT